MPCEAKTKYNDVCNFNPVLRSCYAPLLARAQRNAIRALDSEASRHLLHDAESIASRGDGAGAFDSSGIWHPGVCMYRTYKWEPRASRTARIAGEDGAKFESGSERLPLFFRCFFF